MSSSISSSEPALRERAWRRFAVLLAGLALALLAGGLSLAFVLDPYDTGRPGLVTKEGVPPQGPRTANASRARDESFRGAVIGNSHVQLLMPDRLSAETGLPFVSLTVPGTGPKEQMAILAYARERRARPLDVVIIGLDGFWCSPDPAMTPWNPFPFWLYDTGLWGYAGGLVRWDTLEAIGRRLRYLMGRLPRARPDGAWDYEIYRQWQAERIAAELAVPHQATPRNDTGRFPAFERLGQALAALDPATAVVLVAPPVFASALPAPGDPLAASEAACREMRRSVAASRPRTALVDWRDDRPENRAIENWFDHTHYRTDLARKLEAEIARTLRDLPPSSR